LGGGAAEERQAVSGGVLLQSLLLQPVVNERVDRGADVRACDGRHRGALERPQGPRFGCFTGIERSIRDDWLNRSIGVYGPLSDPVFEELDLVGCEPSFRGHLQGRVDFADSNEEEAFFGLAGNNGWSGMTSGVEPGEGVQTEGGFLGVGAVAGKAVLLKEWSDL